MYVCISYITVKYIRGDVFEADHTILVIPSLIPSCSSSTTIHIHCIHCFPTLWNLPLFCPCKQYIAALECVHVCGSVRVCEMISKAYGMRNPRRRTH